MAITADSIHGRTLLALRAGAMTSGELHQRFEGTHHGVMALVRAGLVSTDGKTYRLTEAGRAACPFRNPLLAKGPAQLPPTLSQAKENPTMVTKPELLAEIVAAGPQGTTRAALYAKHGPNVDPYIARLNNEGAIFKPSKGVLVAAVHALKPAPTHTAPVSAPADQPPVSAPLPEANNRGSETAAPPPPAAGQAEAMQPAGQGANPVRPVAPSSARPDRVEFGLWDDGSITI